MEEANPGISYKQPKETKKRLEIAQTFVDTFQPKCIEVLVDSAETNAVEAAFEARPERMYVLYKGKIIYRGGVGPYQYSVSDVRKFLVGKWPQHAKADAEPNKDEATEPEAKKQKLNTEKQDKPETTCEATTATCSAGG
eukprot:TRINITY_DN48908_c0_g1_i1.p2 TRINITY_DN48908_c0_g1~~TRINITY_DN48908_c0_g1_i1.p2  ORF type:complete len:139 (+),score=29.73 TRINITY_DN48908_c0_g1_i1:441-857(+)